MSKFIKIQFLILTVILSSGISYAQNFEIKLIDKKTKESVSFANVCFEEIGGKQKNYCVSDENGKVINHCKTRCLIAISSVGYKKMLDTIDAKRSFVFELTPSSFAVDEVVVTGQYAPVTVDKSIYPVKILNKNQISQRGANSLNDLFKNEVSFNLKQDGILGSNLSMRGLSGNHVKILIDGVPVIGRLAENLDLSQLSLYNIDHVEIVEGPMSVLYGSNSMAGVINLITNENTRNLQQATFNTYYETVGMYNADASFSQSRNKHSFSLSFARNFFGGFDLDASTRSKLWKPKEQYNGDFYYIYKFSKGKLKYQGNYMREELRDYGDISDIYTPMANDQYFYTNRLNNRIEFARKFIRNTDFNFTAAYSDYWRIGKYIYKNLMDLRPISIGYDTMRMSSLFIRNVISKEKFGSKFNYQFGYEITYETATGGRILDNQQSIGDYALFATSKIQLLQKLLLQPGLRLFKNTEFKTPIVPAISALFNFSEQCNMRFTYTRGFRSPSIKELYILFQDMSHNILPNPDLEPEYGHNFNLNLAYNSDKTSEIHFANYELSVFYNDMQNMIFLAEVSKDPVIYKNINISYFKTLGSSIKMNYRFYPSFDFNVSFGETGILPSLKRTQNKLSQYKFTPEFSLETSYRLKKSQIQFTVSYKNTGEMFNVDLNADGLDFGYRKAYNMLDATANCPFFKKKLLLTLGAKNLFDIKNIESAGSSGAHSGGTSAPVSWGRTFFVKLNFQLNKK